jgi:hypothetical protein
MGPTGTDGINPSSNLGYPTDGDYGLPLGNIANLQFGDRIEDAFDKVDEILDKLAPARPPNLSAQTLSISGTYSARISGSGVAITNAIDATTPSASVSGAFGDASLGMLTAFIDNIAQGSHLLIEGANVGTYSALHILTDVDYYLAQPGKSGFWYALTALLQAASALTIGAHSYQMTHSTTGSTPLLNFFVDNPSTPTVFGMSTLSSGVGRYISGVPSLAVNDTIHADFTIGNAILACYNATQIASATCSVTNPVSSPLPGSPPSDGANFVASISLLVKTGQYNESPTVNCFGYNSKSAASSQTISTGSRVDTVSTESRFTSGVGQFPASFGAAYDSTQSLALNEELQLLNGQYRYPPSINYSSNLPTAGPNYLSLPVGSYANMRWVTFSTISISNASAITITLNGTVGFGSSALQSAFAMYVKVIGANGTVGWIDANAAYPGVGSPTNNGDPALVVGSSNGTSKRVTFGVLVKTGTVWIRIGLPSGDTKRFTGVSVA